MRGDFGYAFLFSPSFPPRSFAFFALLSLPLCTPPLSHRWLRQTASKRTHHSIPKRGILKVVNASHNFSGALYYPASEWRRARAGLPTRPSIRSSNGHRVSTRVKGFVASLLNLLRRRFAPLTPCASTVQCPAHERRTSTQSERQSQMRESALTEKQLAWLDRMAERNIVRDRIGDFYLSCRTCNEGCEVHLPETASLWINKHYGHATWIDFGGWRR